MQFGINLLPTRKKDLAQQSFFRQVKLFAGAILVLYVVFVLYLLASSLALSASEKKLKQETDQVGAKIKSLQKTETLSLVLKERVKKIEEILKGREEIRQARASQGQLLAQAQTLTVPGTSLTSLEAGVRKLTLSGQAPNALVLGNFLDQFSGPALGWSWVHLEYLARNTDGTYNFSLKIEP